MPSGIVKVYWPDKAFGFISPNDGGRDVFVHRSEVRSAGFQVLEPQMPIAFDLTPDPVKPGRFSATNLRLSTL